MVYKPVWPGTVTNEAGDSQTHALGKREGKKKGKGYGDGRWAYKQTISNNLRRKVNLLNMISECKIVQYNTI